MIDQRHDDRDRQRRYDSAARRRHTTSDAIERRSPTMTPWYPSRRPVRRLVAAWPATGTWSPRGGVRLCYNAFRGVGPRSDATTRAAIDGLTSALGL